MARLAPLIVSAARATAGRDTVKHLEGAASAHQKGISAVSAVTAAQGRVMGVFVKSLEMGAFASHPTISAQPTHTAAQSSALGMYVNKDQQRES